MNFGLCWVFIAVCRLSLVAASRGYPLVVACGFSLWWPLLLWAQALRARRLQELWRVGSKVAAPRT